MVLNVSVPASPMNDLPSISALQNPDMPLKYKAVLLKVYERNISSYSRSEQAIIRETRICLQRHFRETNQQAINSRTMA